MKKHRIQPGWRMSLAQLGLRLLFGRRWHYISPWTNAGLAAALVPLRNGRVMMAERRSVEEEGKWGLVGGFLDLERHENFPEAMARELWEEVGVKVDAGQFPTWPSFPFINFGRDMLETTNYTTCAGFYVCEVGEDFMAALESRHETGAFGWFNGGEVEQMIADGRIPAAFKDSHHALREVFRRLGAGERFPLLKVAV